ncbi:MAG: LAGLIDADG family homing endonuclease [Candidatus Lokiarchaeia archaeon]
MNNPNEFFLEEDEILAELIGILLGDGHLHKKGEKSYLGSVLSISLNRVEEPEYVKYVRQLLIGLFNEKPKMHPRIDSKSIDLKIYNDQIIDFMILKGLLTGDKVKNQISVPDWIKKDDLWIANNLKNWELKHRSLVIGCLRGLVDTDGSIYVDHFNKIIGIGFKNASLSLVQDFKEMCKSFEIRTGKITESPYISKSSNKMFIAYQVLIRAKRHVKKFLELIKPKKREFKRNEIEKVLNSLGSSIEQALESKYKRKDSFIL